MLSVQNCLECFLGQLILKTPSSLTGILTVEYKETDLGMGRRKRQRRRKNTKEEEMAIVKMQSNVMEIKILVHFFLLFFFYYFILKIYPSLWLINISDTIICQEVYWIKNNHELIFLKQTASWFELWETKIEYNTY